jgi:hypothetical protein
MGNAMKPKSWLPYVAPFAIYFISLWVRSARNLIWAYPVTILAIATALWIFRGQYDELRPNFSILAVIVGLAAIAIWIGIDSFYPKFGKAEMFNANGEWVFIGFRVVGAVVVVPLMEELFWRAFLIRWLVNEDFKRVPVGAFSWPSFAITVTLFGAEHREWLAGLICGAMYNWLLYKRKDIFSCVVAHAVSNAALAAWVLTRGDWKFW